MSPRLVGLGPDRFLTAARRVMARCDELARVTATPGEGIERVYLSPEHARVNRLAAQWMREIGMTAHQDAAGNQVGRMAPADGDPDANDGAEEMHLGNLPGKPRVAAGLA